MFDNSKQKNKQDYVVKLWSQILERLVRNSDLRLKWGESGFARIDYSSYMAEMRVLVGNQNDEYELMCVKVSKGSPSMAKFYYDHSKLLIESKDVLDNSPVPIPFIPSVQFCGHELFEFKPTHFADNLYVAQKASYAFAIEKKLNKERKAGDFNSQETEEELGYKTSPHWYPPSLTQQTMKLNPIPKNLV